MMTVAEYAFDIKKSVAEVLEKCQELKIKVADENDVLEEEAIIDLDNAFVDDEEVLTDADTLAIISEAKLKVNDELKKEKLRKKQVKVTDDFIDKRKAMYKNKEKLMSNLPTNQKNIVIYKEKMTVTDLATSLNEDPLLLLKKLIKLGVMVNINSNLSFDEAELLVIDYDMILKREETQDEINFEKLELAEDETNLVTRPPVVTIMGHVDHGKTSLLDKIRKANVTSGEAGGITQHIGTYQVAWHNQKITFIDTPGHAAFTEMRARGASVTDIIIIIVAADDGVMTQTKEVIDHAKAAKVPIIVAINKIDKKEANIDKVMAEIAEEGLTPEEWGGEVIFVKLSALTGEGISDLLDSILLVAEMEELKANPNRYAMGSVIEAKLDKKVGPMVTLLIQNGTLRLGDPIVVGHTYGKVRTLTDSLANHLLEAPPSMPVTVTGLNDIPTAGDKFMAFESEKQARSIADIRRQKAKLKKSLSTTDISLESLFENIQEGIKEIKVIIKTDVKGTEEAIKNALEKIDVEGVKVNIIHSGTGTITENDVVLAKASLAIIIGFNVKPNNETLKIAKESKVEIRLYNIIYKVVDDIEDAMKGMLDPLYEEKTLGQAEIRKLFKFSKVGIIAGCHVIEGVIKTDVKARIIRDGIVIYDGHIKSLQREKNAIKEAKEGFECGITIENYNDLKEKDIIEAYQIVEIKR